MPPAIFIVVMALQLRYFRPQFRTKVERVELETSFSALSLGSFIPVIRNAMKKLKGDEGEVVEEEGEEQGGEQQKVEADATGGGEDWMGWWWLWSF